MLVDYITQQFKQRRLAQPRYSLRRFAVDLGEDSSTLSALMKGKRPLTPKTAQRLAGKIAPDDPQLRDRFILAAVQPDVKPQPKSFAALAATDYASIHSWEHYAILSLLEVKNVRTTPRALARRLGLDDRQVTAALSRLYRLGLTKTHNGRLVPSGCQLTTTNDVPSSVLRQANRQYIEKALVSLETDPVDRRDITGITMAIDPEKLPEAKRMLLDFRRELASCLESGDKQDVYRLNLQLFPLSKGRPS